MHERGGGRSRHENSYSIGSIAMTTGDPHIDELRYLPVQLANTIWPCVHLPWPGAELVATATNHNRVLIILPVGKSLYFICPASWRSLIRNSNSGHACFVSLHAWRSQPRTARSYLSLSHCPSSILPLYSRFNHPLTAYYFTLWSLTQNPFAFA